LTVAEGKPFASIFHRMFAQVGLLRRVMEFNILNI